MISFFIHSYKSWHYPRLILWQTQIKNYVLFLLQYACDNEQHADADRDDIISEGTSGSEYSEESLASDDSRVTFSMSVAFFIQLSLCHFMTYGYIVKHIQLYQAFK